MAEERVHRRLAAVLAADVAGYSRLMGLDEEGTLRRLKALRKRFVDPNITSYRGRIVKTTGDGMLVEFASAVDAVRCAVEVQRGVTGQNADATTDIQIEFRIGIHVGDIIIDEADIFGDGVNIAARLEGIAEPGGICISDDAYRQIRGKCQSAFKFDPVSASNFDPSYCLIRGCYFRLTDVAPTVGRSEVASLLAGSEGLGTSQSAHHTQRRPQSRDHQWWPVPYPRPCAG